MKDPELLQRLTILMSNPFVVGDDGVPTLAPDFEKLPGDLAAALTGADNALALQELLQTLESLKQMYSDPDMVDIMTHPAAAGAIASLSPRCYEPEPAIFDAIADGDIDAVKAALREWDINRHHGEFDETALYAAMSCMHGVSLDIINLLLDAGADPRKGLTDCNVLHGLGFSNLRGIDPAELSSIIRRCIDLGADIEQRTNKLQWTPLITAVSEWNPIATEALLLAGADVHAKAGDVQGVCYAGQSSLAFAEGHAETMAVVKRFMARN